MIFKFYKGDPGLYIKALNEAFRKRETVRFYREVLKFCKLLTWRDERGNKWGDVIKASARAEIESSKEEKDPEVLARALVNARMAFDEIQEKFYQKQKELEKQEEEFLKSVERSRVRSKYEEPDLFDELFKKK